jgi:YjzC-like protein
MDKRKTLRPGQRAPASGVYVVVGPRGGKTGDEVVVTRGKPLPPTRKPGGYVLYSTVSEGRSKARTRVSIAETHARFSTALKNLAKR